MRRLSLIALAVFSLGTAAIGPSATAEAQWFKSKSDAQSFLDTAAMATRYGIESNQIALAKSQTPAVRQLAERLVADYTKAYDDLAQIAQHASLGLPVGLKSNYQDRLKALQEAPPDKFDAVYLEAQSKAHAEADFYLTRYASSEDQIVQGFVARTLPMLNMHKQGLQQFARR
jgi:putative membrane protein